MFLFKKKKKQTLLCMTLLLYFDFYQYMRMCAGLKSLLTGI